MSQRRCPKCDQQIVSCNDYFFCWRYGSDGCEMRASHREAIPEIVDAFDDEEDFLDWLFLSFVGRSRIQLPAAVTINGDPQSGFDTAAPPSGEFYEPQETPFTETS
jgi:hypothetical protein